MGFDAEGVPEYEISKEDSRVIRAYQVCKAFNCLNYNVYRNNPAWWNDACYALMRTEKKVQSDKQEANNV